MTRGSTSGGRHAASSAGACQDRSCAGWLGCATPASPRIAASSSSSSQPEGPAMEPR
eukprot:CAMPEP_0180513908 /NCGR_PEP_ID=MMETSP1036_2-20121128/52439_1 /TAXON_ID=632150 /ORGANISM="Azadinium spinosum, Strain 3D9" /LENGTH=56 /DNA_ID=CAMNT_0022525279 /DNA_START=24 /DNA_END=190 /DNA_ORIENTATION=+